MKPPCGDITPLVRGLPSPSKVSPPPQGALVSGSKGRRFTSGRQGWFGNTRRGPRRDNKGGSPGRHGSQDGTRSSGRLQTRTLVSPAEYRFVARTLQVGGAVTGGWEHPRVS